MLKEEKIGFLAFCNGRRYILDSLNGRVDDLFEVSCTCKEENGIVLLSPVVKNISNKEICFNRAFVSVILPQEKYEAYTQYNKWSNENMDAWHELDYRGILLTHANGRTTEGNSPFIAMRLCGRGDGIGMHVLPIGDWRIRVTMQAFSNQEPFVQVDLGISDETLAFTMKPGEEWALPEVLLQHFTDFELCTGDLHRFLKKNLGVAMKPMPVEYNTWLDVYSNLNVERLRAQLKAAKEAGCEIFVIDAGWFGPCCAGWSGVGDWRERTTDAFFGKMAEFADEVRAAGLGFGLWMEPERFCEKAPVVIEHPDWFFPASESLKCYRIDLENPEAYAYQKNMILTLIERYGLAYMKTDMNAELGTDNGGSSHYRYSRLFYQIVDEVRALHPEFRIECCASGALRSDLEAMRHFDIFFPSDNGNPFTGNDIMYGFWHRFLPGMMMKWLIFRELHNDEVPFFGTKRNPVLTIREATWEEYEQVDLESLLAASFTGGFYGFAGDLASLTDKNMELVKKYVALYKENRDFMRMADGYCLVNNDDVKALELTDGKNAIIMLQVVGKNVKLKHTIYPAALDAGKMYEVDGKEMSGADIMDGLAVDTSAFASQHGMWRAKLVFIREK